MRPTLRVPLVGLIAGALASIALYGMNKWVNVAEIDAGRYTKMSVSVLMFVLVGFVVGRSVRRLPHSQSTRVAAAGFGASLLGIAAGAVLWAFVQGSVTGTLFVRDIATLWMFGALPILGGIWVGMVGGDDVTKLTTSN